MKPCTEKDLLDFPDLDLFEDHLARDAAFRQANACSLKRWSFLVYVLGLLTLGILLKEYVSVGPFQSFVSIAITMCVVGTLFYGWRWAQKKRIQHEIRIALVKSGVPVCITCGYCLRGIVGSRCPDCGSTVTDS